MGILVEPEFILDEIEKRIEKGKGVLFPGFFAKFSTGLYRLSPSLYTKMIPEL